MKTEIEISVPKTVRFDGWHCEYMCDLLRSDDKGVMCELFDHDIVINKFKFDRLLACVERFGEGE